MSKLKLELDALCVESFETASGGAAPRGTVRGAQDRQFEKVGGVTTPNDPSWVQTCLFYTCGGCTTVDPAYCPPVTDQAE
jgi:hypothetical protein